MTTKVLAIATWTDADGSFHEWPQATKDNRKSRVLARIRRFNMPEPVDGSLMIERVAGPLRG